MLATYFEDSQMTSVNVVSGAYTRLSKSQYKFIIFDDGLLLFAKK